jgi:hypothetical protein
MADTCLTGACGICPVGTYGDTCRARGLELPQR